jgi:hypothetical protein
VRRGAAAFVNLADLVTVVEQGGTWRTQATYRVKNLSRQFLAVEIPDGSEILSVTVQHKPARAVRATVKGKSFNLIPLPEVSEGDLSFDVQMVVGGRLARGSLPEGPRLFGDKVSLVTPQVVTWESDADYGIPVARTRWTVWFPKDEQVRVLTSSQDTNLDRADESSASVFERSALLDEARQLLSVVEAGKDETSTELARGNLRELDKKLNDTSGSMTTSAISGAPQLQSEVEQQKEQSVLQKLKDVREMTRRGEEGQSGKEAAPAKPLTPESQSAQARDLLQLNESNAKIIAKSKSRAADEEFGFRKGGESAARSDAISGFAVGGQGAPQSREQDRTEARPAADLAKQFDALSQPGQQPSPDDVLKGLNRQVVVPGRPSAQAGAKVFDAATGNHPVAAPAPENPETEKKPTDRAGDQGFAEFTNNPRKLIAKEEASRPHSPGTLSLAFDIPKEGQMLIFTKAGGDPKLTVELRPRKSLELVLGALWMLPWLFLLVLAIVLIGRNRYSPTAWRQFPFGLIAVGLLLFVFLPAPASLAGLVLVAVGTIQASVTRRRQAAGR